MAENRPKRNDPLVSVSGGVYVWGMVSNTSSTVVAETFGGLFESVDAAERTLVAAEAHIGMLRAIQMDAIDFLDRAQVATADGARTMRDWVAAKADVSPETARDLVRTARYTENRPELRTALLEGDATFDRVVAAARITVDTSEPLFRHLDVAGVRREAARCRTITAEEEQRTFLDRFLVGQPSLDESWWKVFGGLDGYLGALFFKTLDETADQLPDDPQAPKDSSWRRATALGLLVAGDTQAPPQLTVFVDADQATPTDGRAGVYLEAGPRVGRTILETILCDAVTEVIGITGDGTPPPIREKVTDHPTSPPQSHHPPGRKPMRHRRLRQPPPPPSPPHHPLEPRRRHQPRKPHNPLLVPPPHSRPPTRTHPHPRPPNPTLDPHPKRPLTAFDGLNSPRRSRSRPLRFQTSNARMCMAHLGSC